MDTIFYHQFNDLGIPGVYDMEKYEANYRIPDISSKTVLDVGCASGWFTRQFIKNGAGRVDACDISVGPVDYIRNLEQLDFNIHEVDCYNLPVGKWDVVFCGSLLMHTYFPMLFLKHLVSRVKEGGLLIVSCSTNNAEDSSITVFSSTGRPITKAEDEVKSCHESLWWISDKAYVSMMETLGFNNTKCVGKFDLESTDYGKSNGQDYNTPHLVWHTQL